MPEKLQTILFLVRHGQTDSPYSLERTVDDRRRLTELGRKQAVADGRYLSQFVPSAMYSSPLERCVETAEIIKRELEFKGEITLTDQLAEIYLNEPRAEAGKRGESIFQTVLAHHAGQQVVAVTHQYIIGYVIADFLGKGFHDVPCQMGDIYRLVFAGDKLVEASHLQPAKDAL